MVMDPCARQRVGGLAETSACWGSPGHPCIERRCLEPKTLVFNGILTCQHVTRRRAGRVMLTLPYARRAVGQERMAGGVALMRGGRGVGAGMHRRGCCAMLCHRFNSSALTDSWLDTSTGVEADTALLLST